mmetsp:Transcript_6579/g.16773  ORF Transcript_6579/g.16773 Transcript_6579/m.16773 type:complete len:241 (-) Transcript_6579:289-1011(-)
MERDIVTAPTTRRRDNTLRGCSVADTMHARRGAGLRRGRPHRRRRRAVSVIATHTEGLHNAPATLVLDWAAISQTTSRMACATLLALLDGCGQLSRAHTQHEPGRGRLQGDAAVGSAVAGGRARPCFWGQEQLQAKLSRFGHIGHVFTATQERLSRQALGSGFVGQVSLFAPMRMEKTYEYEHCRAPHCTTCGIRMVMREPPLLANLQSTPVSCPASSLAGSNHPARTARVGGHRATASA